MDISLNLRVLERIRTLDKMLVELKEYEKKVSIILEAYDSIRDLIMPISIWLALSQIITLKQQYLKHLLRDIQLNINRINCLKANTNLTEEAELMVSNFELDDIPVLLYNTHHLKFPNQLNLLTELKCLLITQSSRINAPQYQRSNYNKRSYYILSGHSGPVTSVLITEDEHHIFSGSCDSTIRIWCTRNKSQVYKLAGRASAIKSVCISKNGKWVIFGSMDNTVRIWSVVHQCQVAVLSGHRDWVSSISMSGYGRWILTGSWDRTVRVWDMKNQSQVAILSGHTGYVYSIFICRNDRWVVTGSADKSVRLWDMYNMRLNTILTGHTSDVRSVCISED